MNTLPDCSIFKNADLILVRAIIERLELSLGWIRLVQDSGDVSVDVRLIFVGGNATVDVLIRQTTYTTPEHFPVVLLQLFGEFETNCCRRRLKIGSMIVCGETRLSFLSLTRW